ncbi:MAG: hypothetical protein IKN87_03110 [Bacilli bacterium]|nr:hypothetical protein [Bacilli bacterium]
MRKILFILFLLLFNILLIYSKVKSINNINLKLKKDELAIVLINNPKSKSILLLKNDISILYILDYQNDENLKEDVLNFASKLDYVFMNSDYDVPFKNKQLIKSKIIEKIIMEPNKITYNNYRLCIDKELSCDITYLIKEKELVGDNLKSIIYNNEINPNIQNDWLDTYSIGYNNYIIIFMKDSYEINNLAR